MNHKNRLFPTATTSSQETSSHQRLTLNIPAGHSGQSTQKELCLKQPEHQHCEPQTAAGKPVKTHHWWWSDQLPVGGKSGWQWSSWQLLPRTGSNLLGRVWTPAWHHMGWGSALVWRRGGLHTDRHHSRIWTPARQHMGWGWALAWRHTKTDIIAGFKPLLGIRWVGDQLWCGVMWVCIQTNINTIASPIFCPSYFSIFMLQYYVYL